MGVDLRDGWNKTHAWQADIDSDPRITMHFGVDSTQPPPDLGDPFTVIIDDGAHDWPSQFATFQQYWPVLKESGVYYIEDIENDNSMKQLIQAIAQHCAGQTIAFNIHLGLKHGREDDRILAIQKVQS